MGEYLSLSQREALIDRLRGYCSRKGRVFIDVNPTGEVYSYDYGGFTDIYDEVPEEVRKEVLGG